MSAKVILFDIETTPTLGWAWRIYDTNLIKVVKPWHLLSFSWKELGSQETNVSALPDYVDYEKDMADDRALAKDLWSVLDSADIVVAHNGDQFDVKFANARFLKHELGSPSPYKTVDTLKIARKHFKFESNKLTDLGHALGVGVKVPHTGFSMWEGCMAGDPDAWELLKKYNVGDTLLLEAVYYKLRPWAVTHPDVTLYGSQGGAKASAPACPSCGSIHIQRRGKAVAKTRAYQRFHCQDCGHWFAGDLIKPKKDLDDE